MTQQLPLQLELAPHARFETFYAGSNAPALAALRSRSGGAEVVWIWGPAGAGKSHLLQGACAAQLEGRVMYLPLDDADQIDAQILDGLDSLDLVAVDDVDRVAGQPSWNRALFSLFNGLQAEGGRLVLSASQPPASIEFDLADFASRAASATVYQLNALSDDERLHALKLHAAARGIELAEPAANYLVARVRRDMSAIVGWLDRLDRASLAAQRKITIPLIRDTLAGGAAGS